VKKFLLTLFISLLVSCSLFSQSPTDTLSQKSDTVVPKLPPKPAARRNEPRSNRIIKTPVDSVFNNQVPAWHSSETAENRLSPSLSDHPYFNLKATAIRHTEIRRQTKSNDLVFYVLLGLFFYFALVKIMFNKYVSNLMAIFLRITLKQQQLREQLLQSPLPSLLLNILFVVNGGIYLSLLLDFYGATVVNHFWLQAAYCCLLLVLIYTGKLIVLKSLGWVFNIQRAADTYLFIVFLVNKMLGIFLLPFLVLIIFEPANAKQVFVTLSLILIISLLLYRFVFSFRPVQNEIRWSLFHFFIYLCAFELAPLILIYKVLIDIVEKSH
jgi:hypothetical protein